MEVSEVSLAQEPSGNAPRSKPRWLMPLVLLVAALSVGYFLRPRNQEGQWLVGSWKNVETFSDDSRVEREWIFEPQGRVSCTNQFLMTGDRPAKGIQKFAGQWSVHDGSLFLRIDRSPLRSLVQSGTQAYATVRNAVTGSNLKMIDPESPQGTLEQSSHDRFVVTWIDPSAPDKPPNPQTWSRLP